MAEQDLDELQRAADERIAAAHAAEADLLEHLQNRGLVEVWKKVKDGLHCEKFLESRTGKHVVDRLVRTITDAQEAWLLADDPLDPEVVKAHRRAQAAHMAIFALDEVLLESKEAQNDLERIQREVGND
jgi:hypothetical protein